MNIIISLYLARKTRGQCMSQVGTGDCSGRAVCILTFHVQKNGQVDLGLGVHLAFVNARVPLLHVLDAQVPLVWRLGVYDPKPRIPGICEDAGRQNVQVAFPHPRHLKYTANFLRHCHSRIHANKCHTLLIAYKELRGLWPRREYTDWATAACRRR
jgi:hypothetical protein